MAIYILRFVEEAVRLGFPLYNGDEELAASSGVKTGHNPFGVYLPAQTEVWNI